MKYVRSQYGCMPHGNDDSMMPDPPATQMRGRMNRNDMPNPPEPVREAMEQLAEMEQRLEEMRREMMNMRE